MPDARTTDPELQRFGLGVMGILQCTEAMIAEGMRLIASGTGRYAYKARLGGEECEVRSVLVMSTGAGATLRTRAFLRASDLLHALYYRGWFLRAAPRLPFRRRPLWRQWIRSRL